MGIQASNLPFLPEVQYSPEQIPELQWIEEDLFETGVKKKLPVVFHQWKSTKKVGEAAPATAHFTILYSGGNLDNLMNTASWCQMLCDSLHVNILRYDFSSVHVPSEKPPSDKQFYEDITCAYLWLTRTQKIPSNKIILYGKSFGTGPTLELSNYLYSQFSKSSFGRTFTRRLSRKLLDRTMLTNEEFGGFAGIILQTPMTSLLDIHSDLASFLAQDIFENTKKVSKIKCPVLFIHGARDEIIPSKHSTKIIKNLPPEHLYKFLELPEGTHTNLETTFGDDLLETLSEFIFHLKPRSAEDDKKPEPPASITSSPANVIGAWLSTCQMQKYLDCFLKSGYYDLKMIASLCLHDLEQMGISSKEDQNTLMDHIGLLIQNLSNSVSPAKEEKPITMNSSFESPTRLRSSELQKNSF